MFHVENILFMGPRINRIVVNCINLTLTTSVWNLCRFDLLRQALSEPLHHQDTSMWSRLAKASQNVIILIILISQYNLPCLLLSYVSCCYCDCRFVYVCNSQHLLYYSPLWGRSPCVLSHMQFSVNTVDLVIFACFKFSQERINEFSFLFSSAIIIIIFAILEFANLSSPRN